jgi:hypothetical protein
MFSSDRAIREYCADIWHVTPVHVEPGELGAMREGAFERAAEASARVSGTAEWVARYGK